MLGIKQMDFFNRSEISHETQMSLYDLARLKGSHNDSFVVKKGDMIKYIEDHGPSPVRGINDPETFLHFLEKMVVMMKTNNLYIQ